MFKVRTTPVEYGTQPYKWNIDSVYQCTWYSYYRALEVGFTAPCWFDGKGDKGTGAYTNAKEWLNNYRSPWQVKDRDYIPVAGDIAVFDGQAGHVQFFETNTMFSEYQSGNPNSFKNGTFVKKSNLLGFLHYPFNDLNPVERNTEVNQILTSDTGLRIRNKPSLEGNEVGHVQLGYYNVLQIKKASTEDIASTPGLKCWYQLAKDRWCANITTTYLPANDDTIKQLEEIYKSMKIAISEKDTIIKDRNDRLDKIKELANYE